MFKSITARKVAENTIYQLTGKVLTMSVTILVTIIITRSFSRASYGEFSIMQNFPALFFIIADFGLNAIAARELSVRWEKAEQYLGNVLVMRFMISLILMSFAGLSLIFFPYSESLKFGVYLSLFLILTQALFATTNIIFQVKHRYDLSTIGNVLGSVLILGLVLILSYLNVNIVWVNFSYVLGGILTFLVNIYFVKKLGLNIVLQIDWYVWKYLIIQSIPIGLMFIFSQISFKADSIILSVVKLPIRYGLDNTESVAIYGLPYKIFEVSLVFPTFFMNSVYPVFVRNMNKSKYKLKESFLKSLYVLLFAGLVFGVIGIVFSSLIIKILGGEEFVQSVIVLKILLGGVFIFYLTQPISWLIVTLGKQKYLPMIYFMSAVFNVTANIFLIPKYSFYASSVLTWVSEIFILILLLFAAKRAWALHYA